MAVLYNLILTILFPFFVLVMYPLSLARRKWRRGFFRKLGVYGGMPPEARPVVFHCVSVGETLSAVPLIKRYARDGRTILFTVTTETGWKVAREKLANVVERVEFYPLDFPFVVARFMNYFKPSAIVITETELWPNLIWIAGARGIPVVVVNGRISDRSFPRYMSFRWFFRHILGHPVFLMQTQRDRDRIVALGAPAGKVHVTGNIKFDMDPAALRFSRSDVGLNDGDTVIVAGSTHGGEEGIVLDAFGALKKGIPGLSIVLAPRHPERFDEVYALIRDSGFTVGRRSCGEKAGDVLLLDTIGELSSFYALGDIAFVGGSLVAVGGHNILEPASCGKPVVFGPHMNNFQEMATMFIDGGGAVQTGPAGLCAVFEQLITDIPLRRETGEKARLLTERNRGSIAKTIEIIERIIG